MWKLDFYAQSIGLILIGTEIIIFDGCAATRPTARMAVAAGGYYYYHSFRLYAHCAFIFNLPENLITFCLPHSRVNTHKSNRRLVENSKEIFRCCCWMSSPIASAAQCSLHKGISWNTASTLLFHNVPSDVAEAGCKLRCKQFSCVFGSNDRIYLK